MKPMAAKIPTRRSFSDRLVEYGAQENDFVVLEADVGHSTYTFLFGEKYPDRYFNLGIAEMGMFSTAAGIASGGRTVVASSYGVFITMRALEAIRSFICYPNLNVKILSSHGGLTAAIDGATHQATEDIANMSTLPNMKVLVPADTAAAAAALEIAMTTRGPVFTRLMRDPLFDIYDKGEKFVIGGSKTIRNGKDVTIACYGDMVFQALEAAEILLEEGIDAEIIDMYSIKPYDQKAILESTARTGALIVVENHQKKNGLGYELAHLLLSNRKYILFASLGINDSFGESGDYYKLLNKFGLSSGHIAEAVRQLKV
ncbi:transketolase C-terminal domain-containing protein [Marispirochaeta sp.]|jgi:transketolase|uniref:transketolase family protein n=1 Tax=Marispirochaeta sp. TaxID=2038653 RepID=UPI0029C79DA6|nr:transketolase C-terminal domain-containing protein [Marispirochaeta sp.]